MTIVDTKFYNVLDDQSYSESTLKADLAGKESDQGYKINEEERLLMEGVVADIHKEESLACDRMEENTSLNSPKDVVGDCVQKSTIQDTETV